MLTRSERPARANEARANKALSIYLEDHLTGATGGLVLAKQLARSGPADDRMPRIAAEVSADRRALIRIMRLLEVRPSRTKVIGAALAARLRHLKRNGTFLARTELGRLLDLEALAIGIQGKACVWRTLLEVASQQSELDRDQLDDLLARAQDQYARVDAIRIEQARRLQP